MTDLEYFSPYQKPLFSKQKLLDSTTNPLINSILFYIGSIKSIIIHLISTSSNVEAIAKSFCRRNHTNFEATSPASLKNYDSNSSFLQHPRILRAISITDLSLNGMNMEMHWRLFSHTYIHQEIVRHESWIYVIWDTVYLTYNFNKKWIFENICLYVRMINYFAIIMLHDQNHILMYED